MPTRGKLGAADYQALAEFRYQIRKFQRFSEKAAREAGLEPQHHQALLAIKGLPSGSRARVGEIAQRLQIQHHSTVELLDRLVKRGLVARKPGSEDRREVLIQLTPRGERLLQQLSLHHRDELQTTGPALLSALVQVLKQFRSTDSADAEPEPARRQRKKSARRAPSAG